MTDASFDDSNLVSCAGLIPLVKLAQDAGLRTLADEHLSVATDKGANAGRKVTSLVAGMVAGADSGDMALLRHAALGKAFDRPYAPSTVGHRGFAPMRPVIGFAIGTVDVDIEPVVKVVHSVGSTRFSRLPMRGPLRSYCTADPRCSDPVGSRARFSCRYR